VANEEGNGHASCIARRYSAGDVRDDRTRTRARLPAAVILLGFTSLFTDVGTEMIFPLLPVFLTEVLKAGPAYIGLVEGRRTRSRAC